MPTNSGWGAAATAAKNSAARPAPKPIVKTAPSDCLGQAEGYCLVERRFVDGRVVLVRLTADEAVEILEAAAA